MGDTVRSFLISLVLLLGMVTPAATSAQVCELHVFVHGSYGSLFSLLSYPYVKYDKIKGTAYVAIQSMLRDTQLVRYRRFAGRFGLFEVTPGTPLMHNDPARYVIGAYDAIRREVHPNDKNQHRYFLFGWTGLLSQRERRREAICLYNELALLAAAVKQENKIPLIKVYCHSHGANLGLNLALVDAVAFDEQAIPKYTEPEVVACMKQLLEGEALIDLHQMVDDSKFASMRSFYEIPGVRLDAIDTLILFGIPVQPETAPLVANSLFSNVLQIYSENDGILTSDTVSSKKRSTVFFDPTILAGHSTIKVIRWMNDRTPQDDCTECALLKTKKTAKKTSKNQLQNFSVSSMMRLQQGGGNPRCHHPQDPTHADFWSLGNDRNGAFFENVPLLVFMPLMFKLLPAAVEAQQLDFCLLGQEDKATALLFDKLRLDDPQLKASGSVSLKPIQWARAGARHVLNVSKKLEIGIKIQSPFFDKLAGK